MTDEKALDEIWRDSWTPPDRRPPWQWGEQHITEIPHSPKSGALKTSESPWIREPLEAIANPRVNLISILAAIQSAKTLFAEIGTAWKLVNSPAPAMILHQKDADAEYYWQSRLKPFYEKIKPVLRLFHPDRFKTKKDSATYINGAKQLFKGAFNIKNLQGHTLREVWGDETWQWPKGHMTEVEARLASYEFNALAVFYSQAGEHGDDTDKKHEATDKREWNYKCTQKECGEHHPFEWSQVEWSDGAKKEDGSYDFNLIRESTVYVCKGCGHRYKDTRMNRKKLSLYGKYFATNPDAAKGSIGFHWNALCSTSWGLLAELYLRAKGLARLGEMEELKKFWQKRLAVSWRDDLEAFEADVTPSNYDPLEQWDEEGIIHRRGFITHRIEEPKFETFEGDADDFEAAKLEFKDTMRGATPLRFLTVDTQQTHFFAVARSWSPRGDSRLLEWAGGDDPKKYPRPLLLWDDIEAMRKKWNIKPALVFIDNGFDTSAVNMECAKRGYTALQGSPRHTFNHRVTKTNKSGKKRRVNVERYYSPMRRVNLGMKKLIARVHYWSNLNIKDTLARLRGNQDPAEGATWEVFEGVESTYLRHLESEQRKKNEKTGVVSWKQIGKRPNHLFDCEAEQVVVATILKLIGKDAVIGTGQTEDIDDSEDGE